MKPSSKQILDFFKLNDEVQRSGKFKDSFIINIPVLTSEEADVFERNLAQLYEPDKILTYTEIQLSYTMFDNLTNDAFQEINGDMENILVLQLGYEAICIYGKQKLQNPISIYHLFLKHFTETNNFSKKLAPNISFAFNLFLNYFIKIEKIAFSDETLIPFCVYLESSPNITIESSTPIGIFLQNVHIHESPSMCTIVCNTVNNLIKTKAPFIDTKHLDSIVDVFSSLFNKFDERALDVFANFSNYTSSDIILQMYAMLPSVITSELTKEYKKMAYFTELNPENESKFSTNDVYSNLPQLFPPLPFSLIENTVTFEDLFNQRSINLLNSVAATLMKSSQSSLVNFIKSYDKVLKVRFDKSTPVPVLGGFVYILSKMKIESRIRVFISSLLPTFLFNHEYCIFKVHDKWINLMRNVAFSAISLLDPMQFLIILGDATDDPYLFAEYVLRLYYHWNKLDFSIFSHPYFIKILLQIDSLSQEKQVSSECRVILYTFMFDLLQKEETSKEFFNLTPQFYEDFLKHLFEESLETKVYYSIKFYLTRTIKTKTTLMCDYLIENDVISRWYQADKTVTDKVMCLIIESMIAYNVVNESFSRLIPHIVDILTDEPSNTVTPVLMSYFSQRCSDINYDELVMIYKHIESFKVDNRFRLRMWEIAAGKSSFPNFKEIHLLRPLILPLLFNVYETDEIIEYFLMLIEFTSVNAYLLHDGEIDLVLLKHIQNEEDVEYRNCKIHIKINNMDMCTTLLEKIMKTKSDNSIVSIFVDAFSPEHKSKNIFKLAEICNDVLAVPNNEKSPVLAIGQVPTQMKTNVLTNAIFQTGFTFSIRTNLNPTTFWGTNMKVTLFKIKDNSTNYLRLFLCKQGISLSIRNGRKKISAIISRFSVTTKWMHIMVSIAVTPTGIQCWPVIDEIETNCTNIKLESCFGEELETEVCGCEIDEMESSCMKMIPVGIATHAALFNRPLTDVECNVLRDDPYGTTLNPCFVSSADDIYIPNINLVPHSFIDYSLQCLMFERLTNVLFSPIDMNANDDLILTSLGILQQLIRCKPSLISGLPVNKISRFLFMYEHPSYKLFRGVSAFHKSLHDENVFNEFLELVIANPFIWSRSPDALRIFTEIKRKIIASSYILTPKLITLFIKIYEKCDDTQKSIIEEILSLFAEQITDEHVSLLFAISPFVSLGKLSSILSLLLSVKRELLTNNQNKIPFISFLHTVYLLEDSDIIVKSVLLIHSISDDDEGEYLLSVFFTFNTSRPDTLLMIFKALKERMSEYPNIVNILCATSITLGENEMQKFSQLLYPLSLQSEFRERVSLRKLWFIYPLLLTFRLKPDDQEGTIRFIIELLLISKNASTDLAKIHAFCEYCEALYFDGAKRVGVLLLTMLISKINDDNPLKYQICNYLSFSLTFHIAKGASNANIDKTQVKEAKDERMRLETPTSLVNFSRIDFNSYSVVFQIILKDGKWINEDIAKELIRVGSTLLKNRSFLDVVRYFVDKTKVQNMNHIIESRQKIFENEIRGTIIIIGKELNELFSYAMDFVTTAASKKYDDFIMIKNEAEIKYEQIPADKARISISYTRDCTLTQLYMQTKLKRVITHNDPYDALNKNDRYIPIIGGVSFITKLKKLNSFEECVFTMFFNQFVIQRDKRTRLIPLDEIEQILLRNSNSIEFLLSSGKTYYLSFIPHDFPEILQKIYDDYKFPNVVIRQQTISYLMFSHTHSINKWNDHRISNFQLIIYLNHLGGRSFKCKDDYPIFPRVFDVNFNIIEEEPPFELEHRGPLTGDFTEKVLTHDVASPESFFFPEMLGEGFPKDIFMSEGKFVYKARVALESEQVSKWLPDWINHHFGVGAKFNQVLNMPLKPRGNAQPKEMKDSFLLENTDSTVMFIACFKNEKYIVTTSGDVFLNNEKIGKIETDDSLLFTAGKSLVVCYSRKRYLIWIIKKDSITRREFNYQSCCLVCAGNRIYFQAGQTCISEMSLDSTVASLFCSTTRRITKMILSKTNRTFVIATDDNMIHIYSSKNRLVNEVQFDSEVKVIHQSAFFGFIYVYTRNKITVLTTNGNFVSSIPFKEKIVNLLSIQNYKTLDIIFCQTETELLCFSAVFSESKEIMKTTEKLITVIYDKQNFNINLIFASGKIVHLPHNFM